MEVEEIAVDGAIIVNLVSFERNLVPVVFEIVYFFVLILVKYLFPHFTVNLQSVPF